MKKATKYVKNDLFQQQSDFFSPLDRGQVKYEMLRAHSLEGHFITKVCNGNGGRWCFCCVNWQCLFFISYTLRGVTLRYFNI